jgi:hypothetical protein
MAAQSLLTHSSLLMDAQPLRTAIASTIPAFIEILFMTHPALL